MPAERELDWGAMSEPKDNIPELRDISGKVEQDHVDRVLAQWAEVRPDLDTGPVALIARLGRATAYIDDAVNRGLAEFGLSREAWDVLASLRRSGPPFRLSPTQLYVGLMRSSGARQWSRSAVDIAMARSSPLCLAFVAS